MTNAPYQQAAILQDRFGLKVAARLSDGTAELSYDVSERLRAARVRAVAQRRSSALQVAPTVFANGGVATLGFGDEGLNLWSRIGSVMPLIALVLGLLTINYVQNADRALEVAEVDAALLTDDLPPTAYTDPGFVEFLKVSQDVVR